MPLTEVERREPYFKHLYDQPDKKHSLVQLIKQCLHDDPACRPSAVDVWQSLEAAHRQIKLDRLQQRTVLRKDEQILELQSQVDQLKVDCGTVPHCKGS